MNDPLADMVGDDGLHYGLSRAQQQLTQIIQLSTPEVLAEHIEMLIQRLSVLENYLEDVKEMEISSSELSEYLSLNKPKVDEDTQRIVTNFFGQISRREG